VRLVRVDKNPIGLWHPLEQANKDPCGVVVVEYNFWEIRSSKWRRAWEAERRVSELRDEGDGDGDAVLDEQLGQLDHRREVADAAETRVQNDGLVHRRTA